jgi:hypothetical protein
MAQNITAVIHASVAYPNIVNQASLILETLHERPLLCGVIQSCLDSSRIHQILIVTSDNPHDERVIATVDRHFQAPHKKIIFHRIPAKKDYSFAPHRDRLREEAFPYMWKPWYGLFTINGFREITAALKLEACVIMDASQCASITAEFLSAASLEIESGLSYYAYNNPYRRLYVVRTSFLCELIEHHKGKIHNELLHKKIVPLLDNILAFEAEFNDRSYVSPARVSAQSNFYPVLRKIDCERLNARYALSLMEFQNSFEILKPQLKALPAEYLAIDLDQQKGPARDSALILRAIDDFSHTGCVLHLSGVGSPVDVDLFAQYIAHAKARGIISVWLETDGHDLSIEALKSFLRAGLDLLVLRGEDFLHEHQGLLTLIETADQERQGLSFFIALTFETDPWLSPQQEQMIKTFEERVDRVIIRSKTAEKKNSSRRSINFAPLQRTVCQQILNSLCIRTTGKTAVCTQDRQGRKPLEALETDLAAEELHSRIIEEQSREEYGNSFSLCGQCDAWYVPNIRANFRNIRFPHYACASVEPCVDQSIDPGQCEHALDSIIEHCDSFMRMITEKQKPFLRALASKKEKSLLAFISAVNNDLLVARDNCAAIKEGFLKLFISIGEAYIHNQQYEDALRTWEKVLRTDPANAYIHRRLDELLAHS